jgi:hypothetical protein
VKFYLLGSKRSTPNPLIWQCWVYETLCESIYDKTTVLNHVKPYQTWLVSLYQLMSFWSIFVLFCIELYSWTTHFWWVLNLDPHRVESTSQNERNEPLASPWLPGGSEPPIVVSPWILNRRQLKWYMHCIVLHCIAVLIRMYYTGPSIPWRTL